MNVSTVGLAVVSLDFDWFLRSFCNVLKLSSMKLVVLELVVNASGRIVEIVGIVLMELDTVDVILVVYLSSLLFGFVTSFKISLSKTAGKVLVTACPLGWILTLLTGTLTVVLNVVASLALFALRIVAVVGDNVLSGRSWIWLICMHSLD
jgi:hypothetical protein